jgi:hypothetical protein
VVLWWIGDFIFLLVIVPVVVLILNEVVRPALEIRRYADDIATFGGQFGGHLDALQGLERTRELAGQARGGLERYSRTLDEIV